MGMWGIGIFDNDMAVDWVIELQSYSDLSYVRNTIINLLNQGDGYLDSDDACRTLAAIEIVARLKGNWGERSRSTEQADDWVTSNHVSVPQNMIEKCIQAINMILGENSELKELWIDSERYNQWENIVLDLKARVWAKENVSDKITSTKPQKRKKKPSLNEGDIFRYVVSYNVDGKTTRVYWYGRVLTESFLAFYAIASSRFGYRTTNLSLEDILLLDVEFIVGSTLDGFKDGRYEIIGNLPLEAKFRKPILFYHRPVGSDKCSVFNIWDQENDYELHISDLDPRIERWGAYNHIHVLERLGLRIENEG